MICYFESYEALSAAVLELDSLWPEVDIDARRVPLTSPVGAGGWLSWGVDPSDSWDESWRQMVCEGLAVGLTRTRGSTTERLRLALARMEDLGIDIGSWKPSKENFNHTANAL
uniref:Uncharacterized protein n=1 Tax=uncultured bacterium ws020C1 TaxID=1131823 RepID=I1X4K8_9BACT|nr:hypothetical protein ws020C1_0028 [uncultured bacterium ws020C1]